MLQRGSSGDEQYRRGQVEEPGEGDLGGGDTQSLSRCLDGGCTENWLLRIEGGAQRKKWDKGNAIRPTGVEDILAGGIGQVIGILYAGDVNQRLSGPVLLQIDVTQSNPP